MMGETEAKVHFLAAKTRVAPTKELTIPRLELMSTLLLCQTVEEALEGFLELRETICFTDSRVSLCWIGGMDREWKQFVENRVVTIRQLVPAQQWRHCPGADNPADVPSRGMSPLELAKNPIWLQGPEWLSKQLEPTAKEHAEIPRECLMEEKKRKSLVLMTISRE